MCKKSICILDIKLFLNKDDQKELCKYIENNHDNKLELERIICNCNMIKNKNISIEYNLFLNEIIKKCNNLLK